MKIIESKKNICWRTYNLNTEVSSIVKDFDEILKNDSFIGLKKINKRLNLKNLVSLKVSKKEFKESSNYLSDKEKFALYEAIKNISFVSKSQLNSLSKTISPINGLSIWDKFVPISKVGLYVPGGTAPLVSSFLMQVIPALTANCSEITICTPPLKNGKVHPAILWLANQLNISNIYKIGGAQAILSMANGYLEIPKVDKIFGPGNTYVAEAKKYVSNKVSIDLYAGPSEVMVVTNNKENVSIAAIDALSQLEHGTDSCAFVLSKSKKILNNIKTEIEDLSKKLTRNDLIDEAFKNIIMVKCKSDNDIVDKINDCAPEHLVLLDDDFPKYIDSINNAGSVFCGNMSPVAFGDYASGTNHVLPTSGWAKTNSGLSVNDFMKKLSFQKTDNTAFNYLSDKVIKLSEIENLDAHGLSVEMRKQNSTTSSRSSFLRRQTKETSIYASVDLDGEGLYEIQTGINFLDHMLEQFAKNSNINLFLRSKGDLEIDLHHTIEDTAIILGQVISDSLADRENINRYSSQTIVMDESVAKIDIDLCSRSNLNLNIPKLNDFVGDFPTEMLNHFLDTFIKNLKFTCHINIDGSNSHHLIEVLFKCLGKAFKESIEINSEVVTSTKGIL
jgi:histidinol dehydrogenase